MWTMCGPCVDHVWNMCGPCLERVGSASGRVWGAGRAGQLAWVLLRHTSHSHVMWSMARAPTQTRSQKQVPKSGLQNGVTFRATARSGYPCSARRIEPLRLSSISLCDGNIRILAARLQQASGFVTCLRVAENVHFLLIVVTAWFIFGTRFWVQIGTRFWVPILVPIFGYGCHGLVEK